MQLVCQHSVHGDCTNPPTGVILVPDWPDEGWDVIGHCDDHAPEIMHELIADGNDRSQMVTCTVNPPPGVAAHLFGPRTLADNIGQRVELAPHLDEWMQGDRYGTIVGAHGVQYTVQMDKSGKLLVCMESEVRLMPTVRLVK